jgi:hypothetical protein
LLTVEGIIDEILPDGRFGVLLDNEVQIIACTAGKMQRYRRATCPRTECSSGRRFLAKWAVSAAASIIVDPACSGNAGKVR